MALLRRQLVASTIQRARVLDVDTKNYVLTVATEFTQKPLTWVSFATPYQHSANGEGVYFMPEVGSICWLVEPSDGGMPFVIAWTTVEDQNASHRARKLDLNPGDIYLGTRDENHILLRRGGVVEIGATPLSQRLFIPIDNVIRDLCENYYLQTLGGDLSWTVKIPENTRDGKRPTTLLLQAREYANDAAPITTVQIGSHGDGDPTILSLALMGSGAKGAKAQINLTLTKEGKIDLKAKGKTAWKIDGGIEFKAPDITLEAEQVAKLIGKVEADVEGGIVNIKSTSGVVAVAAQAGMAVTAPGGGTALTVGAGTHPGLLATPALLAWIKSHAHPVAGVQPGGGTVVSGPPTPQLPAASLQSKDLKTS